MCRKVCTPTPARSAFRGYSSQKKNYIVMWYGLLPSDLRYFKQPNQYTLPSLLFSRPETHKTDRHHIFVNLIVKNRKIAYETALLEVIVD